YDRYNCADLVTHANAQACFNYCVAQGRGDVHKLDRDNDNVACETLP
ncbi:MAG: excalibur calcium-binding domain-containing protein, partial [Anaerolineae bacterium]|nr:excalibur calcium-binding domain-containing protein [Anaerolineae bacterium]